MLVVTMATLTKRENRLQFLSPLKQGCSLGDDSRGGQRCPPGSRMLCQGNLRPRYWHLSMLRKLRGRRVRADHLPQRLLRQRLLLHRKAAGRGCWGHLHDAMGRREAGRLQM